jgi:hypothetical protein
LGKSDGRERGEREGGGIGEDQRRRYWAGKGITDLAENGSANR